MKKKAPPFLTIFLLMLFCSAPNLDALEWHMARTMKLDTPPLDAAISLSGNRIFVLAANGDLLVYTPQGKLAGTIPVGDHVDRIRVGPREDLVLLLSKKNSTVQTLVIDFVQQISSQDAPYKGPANAPVVVTVFDDFQ